MFRPDPFIHLAISQICTMLKVQGIETGSLIAVLLFALLIKEDQVMSRVFTSLALFAFFGFALSSGITTITNAVHSFQVGFSDEPAHLNITIPHL